MTKAQLTFDTFRKAVNFAAGYCVPRAVIRNGRTFKIVGRSVAYANADKVVWHNF